MAALSGSCLNVLVPHVGMLGMPVIMAGAVWYVAARVRRHPEVPAVWRVQLVLAAAVCAVGTRPVARTLNDHLFPPVSPGPWYIRHDLSPPTPLDLRLLTIGVGWFVLVKLAARFDRGHGPRGDHPLPDHDPVTRRPGA